MPKRHTPESLDYLLHQSSGNLAAIAEKSQHIQALNQCLSETVGDTIAQKCRVSNYAQGILTIETVNSAFATRLNFLSSQILLNFRRNVLPELIDIKVKVIPNETNSYQTAKKATKSKRQLSKQSADAILAVSQNAPDKLKKVLERLATNHAEGKDVG